ncbi:CRISPR-associated helicase, Cas3 family [Crinalium epipsammum PCC 9333]|uniref:CRISPR-associated helicase, Cas3 family n=1 Tax=Crinalium epipsammum PCC 9333 TaxID=1173022 RepID=K9VW54_9CYAN|nr:type I-D CRISPR-associated helicase Cas3' [Crinalium epipsammum]AFZ11794.1 CRISPR-associated helicase, Cas3 family [Crinalium epipsammum PCC 9333]
MIKLLSTWSELLGEVDPVAKIQLVTHQKAVWDALRDPKVQIIFDTALTGDGKTLAGLLPAFYESRSLGKGLFAYPTNELIRDQAKQVNEWNQRLNIAIKPHQLNSQSLAELVSEEGFDKLETLRNLASDRDINVILTNPDIFTLIHRFFYNRYKGNIAKLSEIWFNYFRYIVFDEFHIFGAPQVTNVLDAIAFSRAHLGDQYPAKFLFLSATPDKLIQQALDKAGIIAKIIHGKYQHGLKESENHRCILREVELELVASQQSSGGVESWIKENLEKINHFFINYPNSKGLIIVNSVFAAKRIIRQLKDNPACNFTVGENTGLTSLDIRKDSENKQLIIATSTVDVGVDFKINFLIYESLDAGTFIQRLGRLGRHEGFPIYKAIALVPDWVKEKFSELYPDGVEIDRESFFETVRDEIYQKPQMFEKYLIRWGKVLSTLRYARLSSPKDQYQTLLERYAVEASNILGETPKWCRLNELKEHQIIIKDLETFRGTGELDIWVYELETNAISSISLIRLLSGTDFKLLSESEAEKLSQKFVHPFHKNSLRLYAIINNYLDSYQNVELEFTYYLDRLNINQAQQRIGFRIQARHSEIRKINEQLEGLELTTCVADPINYDIPKLKRIYRLPAFFELYLVKDFSGGTYPVAFGQDALLLDSLLFWQKTNTAMIC